MNAPLPAALQRTLRFAAALNHLPLIGVLAGLGPDASEDIAAALYQAGWRMLAVAADAPDALERLAALRAHLPADAMVGVAGLVHPARWRDFAAVRPDWACTPLADPALIGSVRAAGSVCIAGAMTPTEAHAALQAGAEAIALYPGALYGPEAFRSVRRLLPASVPVLLHGDPEPDRWPAYAAAGMDGLMPETALGSAQGAPLESVARQARALAQHWRQAAAPR